MPKRKTKAPSDRNPFVSHIRFKKSGAHGKSKKAERQRNKLDLKKEAYNA